jgi:hypothetical protein
MLSFHHPPFPAVSFWRPNYTPTLNPIKQNEHEKGIRFFYALPIEAPKASFWGCKCMIFN